MAKPSMRAYVIQENKTAAAKPFWVEVGAVWPHQNGTGFDLVIPEGLSVTGRVVCIEPKTKPTAASDTDFAD